MIGCFYLNANAQNKHAHTKKTLLGGQHKTTRTFSHRKAVKDTVVMNFRVCKSDKGYAICGETAGTNNSTYEEPPVPKKYPVYEAAKSDVIVLKGVPDGPKVPFPMNKPGPETQSGAWFGINSWNGIW
jgi:hypothetical protein